MCLQQMSNKDVNCVSVVMNYSQNSFCVCRSTGEPCLTAIVPIYIVAMFTSIKCIMQSDLWMASVGSYITVVVVVRVQCCHEIHSIC